VRGHIAKKGNKYYIVISLKDEVTGKRKVKWLSGKNGKGFDRKKDAEREMPEILASVMKGEFDPPSRTDETFGELMEQYLQSKKPTVRYNTWKAYAGLVRNNLIPHLGHIKPKKLQPEHFERLYHEVLAERLSVASIKKLHVLVCDALNRAMRKGKVLRNVAASVELPIRTSTKFVVWDEEQLEAFLNEAKSSQYYPIYHMAANTGMRQSELLGLGRNELDLDHRTVSVRQALTLDEDGYRPNDTKSVASVRAVALFPETVEVLRQHLDRQETQKAAAKEAGRQYDDHGMVFQTSTGRPISPRNLMRDFYLILDRLEKKWQNGEISVRVPRIRFHDLRHTHATLLLKRGVHPKIVQERLGHSSITVTLDIYSHVLPNLQQAVLGSIGDSILGNKNTNTDSLQSDKG